MTDPLEPPAADPAVAKPGWLTRLRARGIDAARLWGPGLALASAIAVAASLVGARYEAPVMLFALLFGMAMNFLSSNARVTPGLELSAKTLLRVGVALLGVRIAADEVAALGAAALLSVAFLVALCIGLGVLTARLLGLDSRFGLLTSGAVAICGASAALAISAALPRERDSEQRTLFTIVAVTALSTVAMVAYPLLFSWLGASDLQAGFLIGATIHDVAQVVGAGYSISEDAGDTATLVKLSRVALLPIVVLAVLYLGDRGGAGGARPTLPAFLIAFIALATINSLGLIPAVVAETLSTLSRALLVLAIAALGVRTSLGAFRDLGGRPVASVTAATLILLAAGMALVFGGVILAD